MADLPDPQDLEAALAPALALPGAAGQRRRLERLVADYARSHALGERALVVALVGATGAGKSTLLNALAGVALAPEGVDRPTSREAVVYAPEDADVAALTRSRARVERYRLVPGAPWTGQLFVDTPDLNSVEPLHREIARAVLDAADVALLVLHRSSVAEAVQAQFLADFARRRQLVVVLNFADELGTDARTALKAQARKLLAEQWEMRPDDLPCFAISARAAQRQVDVSGELGQLLGSLRGLAEAGTARSIRRTNARAALEELRRALLPAIHEAEDAGRETREALSRGLSHARGTLQADLAERLETAKGHLRDEARRMVASRGWGPLALALRWSGFSSGGLAAGALLVRQSLPLGLAVAGASAALEGLSRRSRARAANSTVVAGDETDDGSVATAVRAALSSPRAEARRRGFVPDVLGLPEPEVLIGALGDARAEAWRFTQGPALVEAVGAWWRWARILLFPLFNLTLAMLAGHVAYRVGLAYYQGQYLEARYYLNAAALLALWAGTGAAAVGMTLRRAVARARGRGLDHFSERLALLEGELLAAGDESQLPLRRAQAVLGSAPEPTAVTAQLH